jgi:hypothetical protein
MGKRILKFHSIRVAFLAAGFVFMAAHSFAQSQYQLRPGQGVSLERFLENYLDEADAGKDMTTRYSSALVDLKDDGRQEVIVYVTGRTWCGSGGCRMLVLVPKGSSYRVVTETTITRLPIRVLVTKSNGWHDLGVWVQGGGIQPGYEADLPFAGGTYPSNPSTPPARRLEEKVAGEVVVPLAAEGTPLYL